MSWKLKRTAQCSKCPWWVKVNPFDIPNGYDPEKHRALENTIAVPPAVWWTPGGRWPAMKLTKFIASVGWSTKSGRATTSDCGSE